MKRKTREIERKRKGKRQGGKVNMRRLKDNRYREKKK